MILDTHQPAAESHESTLNLPRLLCLHGGGTNARIFRAQCRVLERALRTRYRLCFPQGPFPSAPGPDVTSVYGSYGPFFGWVRWGPDDAVEVETQCRVLEIESALRQAMAADDAQGATGEWHGLLGFSQGAKISASLLLSQQLRRERYGQSSILGVTFRFAILLAGRGPLVSLGPETLGMAGLVDLASPAALASSPLEPSATTIESPIRVASVHVHGLRDEGLMHHRQMLRQYFDRRAAHVLEWDGIHRVPIRTGDVAALVNAIVAIDYGFDKEEEEEEEDEEEEEGEYLREETAAAVAAG